MGKRGAKAKHWTEHFKKKILVTESECWEWLGHASNYKGGQPVYSVPKNKLNGNMQGNYLARTLAYLMVKGVLPPFRMKNSSGLCPNKKCVNPDHILESKFKPNIERDALICEMYEQHLKWKVWNGAAIGRKFNLTRERVRQLVKNVKIKQ